MQQKAPDELMGVEGDGVKVVVCLPVPVGKCDTAVIDGNDPVV